MNFIKPIYRKLRRMFLIKLGRDVQFPVQAHIPTKRHGSEDCGWWISPDSITPDSIVYSFGAGKDISFDLSLIGSYQVAVHVFDPTPASIEWMKAQALPDRFKLHETGIADYDGKALFFPPDNASYVSHTILDRKSTHDRAIPVEVRRLSTIMRELGHSRLDILKMDIEGAEYKVLEDIIRSGVVIGQILLEFHHRFPDVGIDATRRAVQSLNKAGYRIFAASENGEEYSFIKVA